LQKNVLKQFVELDWILFSVRGYLENYSKKTKNHLNHGAV